MVQLLHYVYANTNGAGERMQKLVSQFAAFNFPALQSTEEMKDSVRDGDEAAVVVMEKVCRRLLISEDELTSTREICVALEDGLV